MLTHPTAPELTLFEPRDLDADPPPGAAAGHAAALRRVLAWAHDYLCRPHPELGRRGNVCPYAPGALERGTFLLAVRPGRPADPDETAALLLGYRDWFERMCRADEAGAQYRAIVVVFPDLAGDDVRRVIDGTQQRLKPEYVERGLMIGEFHDGPPDKAGLWNEAFRPLRAPLPLLAIRQMVPTDFPFLRDDPELVAAYLARFGDRVPAHLRETVRAVVDRYGLDTRASAEPTGASVPLTPLQQRLWFLNQLDPGNPMQHLAAGLRLRGRLDAEALAAALDGVVADRPVLRTTLAERDGQPVAVLAPKAPPGLPVADLTDRPAGDREAEAARRARAEARRPFDLRRGPLLRGLLVRLAGDDALLVLTAHRLAADETSVELLAAELVDRYAAVAGSGADPRPGAAAGSWAAPGAGTVGAAGDEAALAWWLDRLSGAPELLALPTDRPRPPAQSYRGAVHRAAIPAEVVAGVRGLGVDPTAGLVAALGAVLARHSGQDDVLLGLPVDTRPPESAGAVGPYTNTVVLRTSVADRPSFRQLCARVEADSAAAHAHAGVPFERLVEALDVGRSLDRSPLHQVEVRVRRPPPPPAAPGVSVTPVPVDVGAVTVDLVVGAEPAPGGGLALAVAYAADLMDQSTVERLTEHVGTLLRRALAAPDRPVDMLPMLTAAERRRALAEWQGPVLPLPAPAAAWTLIERWVAATPDAVAVTGPDGELSYRQLRDRAARLAHVLRAWGVGPEVPVGLAVDRSAAMVVALLGVWLAGGAYVPLDPGFPPRRLLAMLDDAGVEVAVTSAGARDRLAGLLAGLAGVVDLDADADVLARQPGFAPAGVGAAGEELAYLIYTSGSTGRPKGVEVPHRAVANLLLAFDRDLRLAPGDRWLAVTTISFDIAALELLLPLASGATVVVATAAETADGAALRRRAERSGATVLQATPSTWRLLLAAGGVPEGVRLRLCGGEAVPRDLADALATGGFPVWNVYGPTETTVWSAAGVVAPAPAPVELGPPIANTTVTVLDPRGEPVPVGVVGEVHIGGDGVARGYRGMPELTARRFGPDDLAAGRAGARRYATGDLARWRPNGRIEFLGRADHQVKVRGFRIELGEIETVLRADPALRDAVVTTWTGGDDDTRLVAYVVPADPDGVDGLAERVRARVRETLPDYMVPSGVVPLDALPVTPNGKVDRRALPEPRWGAAVAAATRRLPRTAVERALVVLFAEVLGLPGDDLPGLDDDFFALGGHSLLGARLLARVRAYFGLDVPTRSLFDAPSVAGMAAVVERLETEPGQAEAVAEARLRIAGMSAEEVEAMLGEAP